MEKGLDLPNEFLEPDTFQEMPNSYHVLKRKEALETKVLENRKIKEVLFEAIDHYVKNYPNSVYGIKHAEPKVKVDTYGDRAKQLGVIKSKGELVKLNVKRTYIINRALNTNKVRNQQLLLDYKRQLEAVNEKIEKIENIKEISFLLDDLTTYDEPQLTALRQVMLYCKNERLVKDRKRHQYVLIASAMITKEIPGGKFFAALDKVNNEIREKQILVKVTQEKIDEARIEFREKRVKNKKSKKQEPKESDFTFTDNSLKYSKCGKEYQLKKYYDEHVKKCNIGD